MLGYAIGRLASLALSLAAASVVVFAVIELIPGDPAAFMLGVNARPDTLAALRAELGLDAPPLERWFAWVGACSRAISASATLTARRWPT
jgi:peptide/nickel transport system permease protein